MKFEEIVRQNHRKSYMGSLVIAIILILLGGFMIWGRAVFSILIGIVFIVVAVGLMYEEVKMGKLDARMEMFYRRVEAFGDREEILAHVNQMKSYPFKKHGKQELRFDHAYVAFSHEDKAYVVPMATVVRGHQYVFRHSAFGLMNTNADHSVRLIYQAGDGLRRMDIPCADEKESAELLEAVKDLNPEMTVEAKVEDGRKQRRAEERSKSKRKNKNPWLK